MTQFITIDHGIVSPDLSDLEILSHPGPASSSLLGGDIPGRFVLKIGLLTCLYLERAGFIPKSLEYIPARRFDLVIYEGSPSDKSTWKQTLRLGDCTFVVAIDRDIWLRFQEERQPDKLDPDETGTRSYLLEGIYQKYGGWAMVIKE